MFQIIAFENSTDHTGKLHSGPVNVDGEDLVFDTRTEALTALTNFSADFVAGFNHFEVVEAKACPLCGGDGWIDNADELRREMETRCGNNDCPACKGTGVDKSRPL